MGTRQGKARVNLVFQDIPYAEIMTMKDCWYDKSEPTDTKNI